MGKVFGGSQTETYINTTLVYVATSAHIEPFCHECWIIIRIF